MYFFLQNQFCIGNGLSGYGLVCKIQVATTTATGAAYGGSHHTYFRGGNHHTPHCGGLHDGLHGEPCDEKHTYEFYKPF